MKIRKLNQNKTYGKIFLHSMPGRYEKWNELIKEVEKLNLHTIICLTSKLEIKEISPEYLRSVEEGKLGKINIIYHPVPDFGIPVKKNISDYESILMRTYQTLRAGNILIHCAGGIGRTGTFAVILLKIIGFSFEEALKITKGAGSNPETSEQLEFCRDYEMKTDSKSI